MKAIIFAGGAGTRLWPLSRQATPKQFEPMFEGKSTLQLAIERISSFGYENIFISTNKAYVGIVSEQAPQLKVNHIFPEPERRDVAAAVLVTLLRLKRDGEGGTVAVLWSDHVMQRPEAFLSALKRAEELIGENRERFVFLGEKPRYANHNLGWIRYTKGEEDGVMSFKEWKYRPEVEACKEMYKSGEWFWNPGYFVFDLNFALKMYELHQKEMYDMATEMVVSEDRIMSEYSKLPKVSFDNAILEKMDASQAVVVPVDMGWSDPGTLYAMKELMADDEESNVERGKVISQNSRDCFVYNTVADQLVTTVGLDGIIVANTKDGLLVCHKDHVPNIKPLLEKIKEEGMEELL